MNPLHAMVLDSHCLFLCFPCLLRHIWYHNSVFHFLTIQSFTKQLDHFLLFLFYFFPFFLTLGMENLNFSSNLRNLSCPRRQLLHPPRNPILSNFPPRGAEYISGSAVTTEGLLTPNQDGQQAIRHQRTSSDSFLLEEQPSWLDELLDDGPAEAPVDSIHRRSLSDPFAYLDATKDGDPPKASFGLPSTKNGMTHLHASVGSSSPIKSNSMTIKPDQEDQALAPIRSDCPHTNPTAANKDSKRCKQ